MALLCGRSWNLLPAVKFKAGACPACGQLPERVLHSWAQVSSQKAAEGLGRSCVPTFNSQLSGGTQDLVLLPQDSQWVPPGAQLPLLEAAQAEGHVPRPAVVRSDLDLPGTTLFLGFAHDTNRGGPSAGAAGGDRASGPTRRQESPEPRRPSQRRAQGDRPHAFYGRTVEAAPPP